MEKKPNISVIVCTRNRNEYLMKCMLSLLRQSHKPKEIIVIDDHSNKDENVLKFFKLKFSNLQLNLRNLFNFDTRIILLRNKKQSGIVKSRNLGIKYASGDIVAFLDDDSFAHKDWLRNLAKHYRNNIIVGVGGPFIELGRGSLKTPTKAVSKLSYISKRKGRFVFNYRIKRLKDRKFLPRGFVRFLLGGNMSFRKDILLKIGGADVRFSGNAYHEETDMSFRASYFGKILFEPNAVTYHDTAKKGGNRDIVKFDLNRFLFFMFRNTFFFFLRHFGLRKASYLIRNLGSSRILC